MFVLAGVAFHTCRIDDRNQPRCPFPVCISARKRTAHVGGGKAACTSWLRVSALWAGAEAGMFAGGGPINCFTRPAVTHVRVSSSRRPFVSVNTSCGNTAAGGRLGGGAIGGEGGPRWAAGAGGQQFRRAAGDALAGGRRAAGYGCVVGSGMARGVRADRRRVVAPRTRRDATRSGGARRRGRSPPRPYPAARVFGAAATGKQSGAFAHSLAWPPRPHLGSRRRTDELQGANPRSTGRQTWCHSPKGQSTCPGHSAWWAQGLAATQSRQHAVPKGRSQALSSMFRAWFLPRPDLALIVS